MSKQNNLFLYVSSLFRFLQSQDSSLSTQLLWIGRKKWLLMYEKLSADALAGHYAKLP